MATSVAAPFGAVAFAGMIVGQVRRAHASSDMNSRR